MKTTQILTLLAVLTVILIVAKNSTIDPVKSKANKETKASIDLWTDTLLYWSNTSMVALNYSWNSTNKQQQEVYYELYQRNDSVYCDLLDSCEKKTPIQVFSKVVENVVSSQL